jgi:hypothetical protein
MFVSTDEKTVISTMGWIEHGGIWIYNVADNKYKTHNLSNAKYLQLHEGKNGYFSLLHFYDGNKLEISLHHEDNPLNIIDTIIIEGTGNNYKFSSDLWSNVPLFYTTFLNRLSGNDFYLLMLNTTTREVHISFLDWYDDSYDKGYQGVVQVIQSITNNNEVIFSIQRSSELIVYNIENNNVTRKVDLAGKHGNPLLKYNKNKELWALDYDTIVKIDSTTYKCIASSLLQHPKNGMGQFCGEYVFNKTQTYCLVSRPFSNDAICLNTKNLKIEKKVELNHEPLEIALVDNEFVIARSWKTGKLITGKLKTIGFFNRI